MTNERDGMNSILFNPNWCLAPGDIIAEILEVRGWTHAYLATIADLDIGVVGDLINGSIELTPEIAVKLEHLLGRPEKFWLTCEKRFRDGLSNGLKKV